MVVTFFTLYKCLKLVNYKDILKYDDYGNIHLQSVGYDLNM